MMMSLRIIFPSVFVGNQRDRLMQQACPALASPAMTRRGLFLGSPREKGRLSPPRPAALGALGGRFDLLGLGLDRGELGHGVTGAIVGPVRARRSCGLDASCD